jgi:mRNA interferase RelE/StbE
LVVYRRLEKDIAGIPQRMQTSLRARIGALAENPRPPDAVRLQHQRSGENYHRIRVGDYRIVYDIQDDIRLVRIVLVGHRRDVYAILGRR